MALARRLDDRGDADSSAGCLIRGSGAVGDGFRLEADVAVAVRPLPDATADVAARHATAPGPVRVLTRWGQRGGDGLPLVAFTSTPPPGPGPTAALLIGADGARLIVGERDEAIAVGEVGARLAAGPAPSVVAVTADAGTPLATVRAALAAVGERAPVTLAVPLPVDTRLPAGEPAVDPELARAGMCEGGLPAAPDARPGALPRSAIVDALGAFRSRAAECMRLVTGPAAAGGALDVAFRIAGDGSVAHACARRDEAGDPGLRLCVLDAARALSFPAPDPPGVVDVALPVLLAPDQGLLQRPLCP